MFLTGLYGDTTLLRYGVREVLRVRLLCEMRQPVLALFYFVLRIMTVHAVQQLVEALRYKPESSGFDSR